MKIEPDMSAGRRFAGELGAQFALKGDRYLPRGGVRHRTQPNFLEPTTLVAQCGISESAAYWRGTGSQEEYERLSRIPRCTRCIAAEEPPKLPAGEGRSNP